MNFQSGSKVLGPDSGCKKNKRSGEKRTSKFTSSIKPAPTIHD